MPDLITIGDSILDTFLIIKEAKIRKGKNRSMDQLCLNFADKIPIEHSVQSVGGNAANVGAAKLGLETAILTELGDDINGHIIRNELCKRGVNDELIRQVSGRETRYSIVINYKSERTILSCHPKRRYTFPHLPKTGYIYYTSLGPGFEQLQKKLYGYLQKHPGIRLAMNPGSYQIKKGLKTIQTMLSRTDLLFVNKEEAERLAGRKADIPLLIRRLHGRGAKTVVITDSTHGSYASDGEQALFMPAYPITPIAKTGAGDAYTSGFLAASIRGENLATAMKWATANAAGVIQEFGAQKGLLTKNGIQKILRAHPNTKPKNRAA
jgi:ribokinase